MLTDRLESVLKRIRAAATGCGRDPESVHLVAVSKTIPSDIVAQAVEAGVDTLGENYVQEARQKIETLSDLPVSWHYIGHLQSNKAKYAVKLFDLIHSVDSFKLARELNKQAAKIDKIQQILIQVNIAEEKSKSGVSEQDTIDLIEDVRQLTNLSIRGLMTMPPYFNAPEKVRPFFAALRNLRDRINDLALENVSMAELSMGMTGDFEAAIEEGATLVRVGTAIFGERH
jgi:pyridoxal phosphate enzyme (YggS family)